MDIYEIKIVQDFIDLKNFFKFRREMKREEKNPASKFNTFKLKRNWLGNIVYMQLNCSDTDLRNADFNNERMVVIALKPVVEYLSSELGWGEYLTPQISNFVDEDGEGSLSYGVLFIFSGYSLTMTKMLIGFILGLAAVAGGIFSMIHFL